MGTNFMEKPWGVYGDDEVQARARIMAYWDQGLDSYAIRWKIHVPEYRIAQVISAYVESKSTRRNSAP